MIRLHDAVMLATTKVRTRKVRLCLTVFIAGLLFSVLAAASFVSRGAFASVTDFSKEGLGSRYILSAMPASLLSSDYSTNGDIIKRAKDINKDIVSRKTSEAKRLGLPYDAKTDTQPVQEYDTPDGKQQSLDLLQPAARQAVSEYVAKQTVPGRRELLGLAQAYGGGSVYESRSQGYTIDAPQLKILKGGKEDYGQQPKTQAGPPIGTDSFAQGWSMLSRDLLQPFMLPGASAVIGKDGSLPVVAPYTAVEQLLGLKPLPATAKPAERLERLKLLRKQAGDIRFKVCYRNQASAGQLSSVISQRQELDQNKNNKDYSKPELLYALPPTPCGAPGIERDVRSADEKKLATSKQEFDREFGKPDPEQQLLDFRVIGIAPDPLGFGASGIGSLTSLLLSSNLGFSSNWFTPLELRDANTVAKTIFKDADGVGGSYATYYVETGSAAIANRMLNEKNCQPDFSSADAAKGNPYKVCTDAGKQFVLAPFGSNSLALESAKTSFSKFFGYAALGVALVAALIMLGTVGRIIADSRRETAVFRAIGAKKVDIVQIYLIYTVFLAVFIFVFALAVGYAGAQYIQHHYSAEFTVQALVSYNARDTSRTFSLFSFYTPDILKLFGLALAGGLLSATLPLLRNLRRNPIRDMRDDT